MSRIILVGCGKSKCDRFAAARDLYTGPLFVARRQYAESQRVKTTWYIVSALHGLLSACDLLLPYDLTIKKMEVADRYGWALQVVLDLLGQLPLRLTARQLRQVHVELHMGADYAELLGPIILAAGMSYSWPVQGMSQGKQLQYYREQRSALGTT